MKRVKTKAIVDEDITEMFNQMMGIGNPDLEIVAPKYKKIKAKVKSLEKIFRLSLETLSGVEGVEEIGKFADELGSIQFVEEEKLCGEYNALKENNSIKMLILTLKSLISFKESLKTNDSEFILRRPK